MAPRYFLSAMIKRPTVQPFGDVTLGSGVTVRASIWDKTAKTLVGGNGELITVNAVGFVPPDTDVLVRDQISLTDGRKWEVIYRMRGTDDRGNESHIGLHLRSID